MSLKDLEHGSFRKVLDDLYCPQCLLKMGQPRKMRCPGCGRETMAVLHEGKYTCTHCGREIGGSQEQGDIPSAKPSASRERSKAGGAAGTKSRRRRNRTIAVLTLLMGVFIAIALIEGALLIHARSASKKVEPADKGQPEESPDPAKKPAAPADPVEKAKPPGKDQKILEVAAGFEKDNPRDPARVIKMYKAAVEQIDDPVLKIEVTKKLLELEKQFDKAEIEERRTRAELTRKLAAARKEIASLRAELKTRAAEKPPVPVKPAPEDPPKPAPEDVRKKAAKAAYQDAMDKARTFVGQRRYGAAMRELKTVADKYANSPWGPQAENERKRVRNDAYQAYTKLGDRAEVLAKAGDTDGARELYARGLLFGVPEISDIARQELARLREGATAGRKPVPAAVRKQIDLLVRGSARERSEAARRLRDLGDRAAVPHLIAALKDESWAVRSGAALALGKLGDAAAVPALIDALGDEAEAVAYDVHQALRAITKQDFPRGDRAKWLEWYQRSEKPAAGPPPKPETNTFASRILARDYDSGTVAFVVPEGAVLAAGTRVSLFSENARLGDVVVKQVTQDGRAFGDLKNVTPGSNVRPNDPVTVHLPK